MDQVRLSPPRAPRPAKRKWRGWWLKQLHTWHWVSAAISLVAMLLFAVTGITLNHAASIAATPVVTTRNAPLPPLIVQALAAPPASPDAPLPPRVAAAAERAVGLDPTGRAAEWSDAEVYVALPRPGGDAWLSIDRASGRITAEITDRGWISYLNDLHKGRNSGAAWFWFIDVFAGACILFTLTGLLLLQLHARHRPSTWPLVAVGLVLPALLAMLFIH
ncbi:PepSY-associated TM helix domain-containing protein [Sphingomonas sp.]|uniref:PepSY-associated TM helix domain-containing protein n=1 Tax=Sphingomonas sp. TaxID=28214 RepID=UPI0035AEC48D